MSCWVIISINICLWYHIVYTDNYYTSLKLVRYLLLTVTDLVGSIRRTSIGFPHIDTVRLGQGDNFKLTNTDGIVVCRYVDKRDVYSLSTVTTGNYVDVPKARFNSLERKLKPEMLLDRSKYMRWFDWMDQARSY